jgi:hypothetical protein
MNTPQPSDQSVLLDYVSPDPVTIIITSLQNHHWRVAWHTFVACTCQISPIPAGHVFTRGRQGLTRATMVNPPNIYVSLGIMVAYCIALPFARLPRATGPLGPCVPCSILRSSVTTVSCHVYLNLKSSTKRTGKSTSKPKSYSLNATISLACILEKTADVILESAR